MVAKKAKKEESTFEERKDFIHTYLSDHPLLASCDPLARALHKAYPEMSRAAHCCMVKRLLYTSKPWMRGASCANDGCSTRAKNMGEALDIFGHRCKGKRLQSYCRPCRNAKKREARKARNIKRSAVLAARESHASDISTT